MKRIDPQTVQRILDTADIVEVVSDFVSLKRRGSSYIGLCPFHNERTPSFSVSRARNYAKCFSCGKGGSAVGFIMEHEQLSYGEALRYLAKKYNIEIKEEELTGKQLEEETERESMLAVNEFALKHFENNLTQTPDGLEIGLAYFRERGISEPSIRKFRLGYALGARDALCRAALAGGYKEKYLVDTGLCIRTERGDLYDRFKGRVIYPVFALSGKVLAFGGRTLRKDKNVAKYVNSPESVIYHKSNVLYGLYQARRSIVSKNKCLLVEGYMDVISMSQRGIENVVASSGTSLTQGQINLIHRFTDNVTVIYDSDPAGIKASLRGIDMLLADGLNIKVLLLPDGDDPDSFAQSHSATEVEEYISANETDFIRFKTDILLRDSGDDPIARSRVISDIIRSISVIPNELTRNEYIKICSRLLNADERVLTLQVAKYAAEHAAREREQQVRRQSVADGPLPADAAAEPVTVDIRPSVKSSDNRTLFLRPYEQSVVRYVVRYGMLPLCDMIADDGSTVPVTVADYVEQELAADKMEFTNADLKAAFDAALQLRESWRCDRVSREAAVESERLAAMNAGLAEIRNKATDAASAGEMEEALTARLADESARAMTDFDRYYVEKILTSSPDDAVRSLATDLVSEKYRLSKYHTRYAKVETEAERLDPLVPRAICEWKDAILACRIEDLKSEIASLAGATDAAVMEKIRMIKSLQDLRREFAKYLGERIITPRK